MAKRTASERKLRARSQVPGGKLYICCFDLIEVGEKDYEGTFQIVVEASDPAQALDRSSARIKTLRRKKTLFETPLTIFVRGLIELNGKFESGLLVNYETGPVFENRGTIYCLIPGQDEHEAAVYGVGEEPTDGECQELEPFLDFGGVAARELLHARGARTAQVGNATPVTQQPAAGATKTDARQQELRRLETERANALAATLAELDSDKASPPKKPARTSKRV